MSDFLVKAAMTGVIIVLALPGLVIEPGPLSEIAAGTIILGIWTGEKSPKEAAKDVEEEATGS